MTDIRAQLDPFAGKLKKITAKVSIEGKIAHLFDDGDGMTNTGARRDLIADLEADQWHIRCITEKMESLMETIDTYAEDAMEYEDLSEELKKAKRKASNKEKIIRAFADKNVEKIYVYP